MNGTAARFLRLGVGLSGLIVLAWVLTGQAARPARQAIPLPSDWSHRHLIFSRPGSAEQLARVSQDPRYWQQIHRREQRLAMAANVSEIGAARSFRGVESSRTVSRRFRRDWSQDLGSTASAGAGNYPAKYSFNSTTANCGGATTPDYVVYSTGLEGAPGPLVGQASIVAFDNLYSGCGGTVPSVYWAYNTSGQVLTSPVISLDGTQVAFVQTNGGLEGTLVVLRWAAAPADTVASPETLVPLATNLYQGCSAPCATTLILRDGSGVPVDDETSSVFYDYSNDIAWVGGATGWLHKITGVFNGTPTEVTTGGFPVQVNTVDPTTLSSPVYDSVSKNVFVGDLGGFLYSVNSSTGAVTASGQLDFGAGLVEGPIVDSTNGFVYVFASSDGSSLCTGGTSACAAVYQLSTTFSSGDIGNEAQAGTSVAFETLPNPNPLYVGGFDSSYFNSVDGTGNLYVCGNTGTNPTVYQIPIQAGVLPASGKGTELVSLVSAGPTPACSPVTDQLNPNLTAGSEERFFVSVQDNGVSNACTGHAGCLMSFINSPWQATTVYQVGQEILDKNLNIETVTFAGTSGGSVPSWSGSAGSTITNDGTVHWVNQGLLTATTLPGWTANDTHYRAGTRILDGNGNIEIAGNSGESGTTTPSWSRTAGGTTTDGTHGQVWTNAGATPSAALPTAGGTSGIIVDNIVSLSTISGASQIYFTTLGNQTCGTSGTGGCAVQAAQPTLN